MYGNFKVKEGSCGDLSCFGLGKTISNSCSSWFLHFNLLMSLMVKIEFSVLMQDFSR